MAASMGEVGPVMYPKGNPSDWIRRAVGPGDVVIDGGANKGGFTIAAAETVGPTGRVFAVEPDPRCADALRELEARFSQVTFIPAALVAEPGRVLLTQGDKSEHSSLVRAAVTDKLAEIEVEGVTLASLTTAPVKAVKLDLQGGERHALLGASHLLVTGPQWCVELWPHAMRRAGGEIGIASLFRELGYCARTLADGYPETPYDDLLAWCLDETHPETKHINVLFTA